MTVVVKNSLGRRFFEARYSSNSHPDVGQTGSTTLRRVIPVPERVTYAPYTIPGWRQLKAAGQDVTTVLIGYKGSEKERNPQYSYRTIFGYPGDKVRDCSGSGHILATYSSIPTSVPSTQHKATALAAEKFLGNYYSKTRSIRGLSSVAEFGSTVRGLASPARALRNEVNNLYQSASRALYRSNGRQVKDGARALGGIWLEWQFGIKPLAEDVNGAAQAVNRMINGDFRTTVPIRGRGIVETIPNKAVNQGIGTPGIYGSNFGVVDVTDVHQTTVVIRGAVKIDTPGGDLPPVMQWGVGFEDILPGVWEGIPWSFFIDYFVNVSSVIEALSVPRTRFAWVNQTIRNSLTRSFSDVRPNKDDKFGNYYQKYSCYGGGCQVQYTTVTRSKVDWRDVAPSLRVKLPGLGVKWANIAALATMASSGGVPRHFRF